MHSNHVVDTQDELCTASLNMFIADAYIQEHEYIHISTINNLTHLRVKKAAVKKSSSEKKQRPT